MLPVEYKPLLSSAVYYLLGTSNNHNNNNIINNIIQHKDPTRRRRGLTIIEGCYSSNNPCCQSRTTPTPKSISFAKAFLAVQQLHNKHTYTTTTATSLRSSSQSNISENMVQQQLQQQQQQQQELRDVVLPVVEEEEETSNDTTNIGGQRLEEQQPHSNPPEQATAAIPSSSSSLTSKTKSATRIDWLIRPATIDDRDECAALIDRSYRSLLFKEYTIDCLARCLPYITEPRQQLLTCNTWYVVEHPSTRQMVGCGGWTVHKKRRRSGNTGGSQQQQEQEPCTTTTTSTPATIANDSQNNTSNSGNTRPDDQETTATTTTKTKDIAAATVPPTTTTNSSSCNDSSSSNVPVVSAASIDPSTIEGDIPHLRHFATHPDYVRCGIASTIWKRTYNDIYQQYVIENQLPFPIIEVFSTLSAQSFYESLGFTTVKQMDIALNNATDDSAAVFPVYFMRRGSSSPTSISE